MLLEEGFQVTSIDASDKMLKYALKKRWERRKEEAFDNWGKRIASLFLALYFLTSFPLFCILQLWKKPIG